ncbi:MAG: DUF4097 domain-containing protein [Erysipelotrichaceae bacterium]|jgi:DUF4097 and DUF4098 domain-containing protein YvlB|nr:DUF4097 domain-containing protein [Erysipelotrichaceae bacterium]
MIKKAIIVPLLLGGVMIVLGGTIAGISAAAAGGFAALSTAEPYAARVIEVPAADLNINVDEENNKVVINTSETALTVSITVYENNHETYVSSVDENDFTLVYHNDVPWIKRIFYVPTSLRTMTITVPENYAASLNINNTNGVIDVDDISLQGELALETANGLISVNNVDVTGNIDVRTTNSKIEITASSSLEDITTRSMNGYIVLDELTAVDIDAQTTNGKIAAEDITAENMKLATTNGQVTTADIDVATKIHLETTNGDIRGNVKGPSTDYDIDSQTTNGSNNLAGFNSQVPSTGSKILYARCYNGAITITFN